MLSILEQYLTHPILYGNIDQTLVNSLHELSKCEKGGVD